MDYQVKNMIVNALMKIVEDAPTKQDEPYYVSVSYPKIYGVRKEYFDIWANYIFSVMKIISSYVDVSICLSNINGIIMQPCPNNEYTSQVNAICRIILDFAQKILYL